MLVSHGRRQFENDDAQWEKRKLLEQNWFVNLVTDFDDNKVLKDQLVLLMIYSSAQDYKIKV
jgi:hypothetical protein